MKKNLCNGLLIATALSFVSLPAAAQGPEGGMGFGGAGPGGMGKGGQFAGQFQGQMPEREIVHVAGDLYRVVNNNHRPLFMVTSEGIILIDPLNEDYSKWLKAELAERYDVPVRYVIYSNHHADHASGAKEFVDTATIVAHENTPVALAEVGDRPNYADVRLPDITYSDQMTITLGGKTVHLMHAPPAVTDDATFLLFPEERTVYAADWVAVRRLPFTRFQAPIEGWLAANDHLLTVDFDILSPGHGDVGDKADIRDYRQYISGLRSAILDGIAEGKSVEDLKAELTLDEYRDWELYELFRESNIEAFYQHLAGDSAESE